MWMKLFLLFLWFFCLSISCMTNQVAYKFIDWLAEWQRIEWLIEWMHYWLNDRLFGWLICWFTGFFCMNEGMIDWMIDWFIAWINEQLNDWLNKTFNQSYNEQINERTNKWLIMIPDFILSRWMFSAAKVPRTLANRSWNCSTRSETFPRDSNICDWFQASWVDVKCRWCCYLSSFISTVVCLPLICWRLARFGWQTIEIDSWETERKVIRG